MPDGSLSDYFVQQAEAAAESVPTEPRRPRRRRARLIKRIAIIGTASLVLVTGVVAAGSYLTVNHLLGSIHRIPGIVALDAAQQPVMPAATRHSMTVLLTGSAVLPAVRGGHGVDGSSRAGELPSGLVTLIHLNANRRGGAVVSIPANTIVNIPGHGRKELWNALVFGGPSLLIRTVEQLTNVRVDHYSTVDFNGVTRVINALKGVNVDVPYSTTSMGVTFTAGIDHLSGATVLPYVRQPAVSEIGRELLEENLIRAILDKMASRHLLSHIGTDFAVLHALAGVLSVDSNFSNSQIVSLALRLGGLKSRDGAFVDVPTLGGSPKFGGTAPVHLNLALARKLWSAIRNDSVAAFARQYPFTVTPIAPG